MADKKHPLPGSVRKTMPGSCCTGPVDGNERFEVSLIIRRPDEAGFQRHLATLAGALDTASSSGRPLPMTREEYAQRFSAAPADLDQVRHFAQAHHLTVAHEDGCSRTVILSGTAQQFNDAFDVVLQHYEHGTGHYRGRTGPVHLPAELTGVVTAVLGLDNRPQARAHFRFRPPIHPVKGESASRAYTPLDLAGLYDFPAGDGTGQCVGIIELGGGYDNADLQTYFTKLGLQAPTVRAISVGGVKNSPSKGGGSADGEVMLDIEIVGAIVPKARLAVYFAANSDQGFINAVNTAIHDSANRPSVVSISWGGAESSWTAQSMDALNDALQSAAALGVTVCVASGDSGSGDGVADGADHVDFPASSPAALACGGTHLVAAGAAIGEETVWNDGEQGGAGGGGISAYFALPSWQDNLQAAHTGGQETTLAKRGVPDVAGNASPQTGYEILVHGEWMVVGGTSAVAPLWAGLIARVNTANGKTLGYINPHLYAAGTVCHDITQGNNGDFTATPGWDACTGLGSPDGKKIAMLI